MKIVYVDMDGVVADYDKSKELHLKQNPDFLYPQAKFDFFRKLPLIKGAKKSILELSKVYDVYFLTAPSYKNPLCYTEKMLWVDEHFGEEFVKKLIISKHKHLNIGDYLIDDRPDYNGAGKFTGELIHFGVDYKTGKQNPFPTWDSVLKYLL